MSSPHESFKALLRDAGQSITTSRLAVFDTLLGQEPLSMHEIVAHTPNIDRASVYRAVSLFERLGIVQRLHTGWKYKIELTDKFAAHHHHLTCSSCGATTAMNEAELEAFIVAVSAKHHFQPTMHQFEIQGICAACQQGIRHLPTAEHP